MEIIITKKIEVNHCGECPFCNRIEDRSVVLDSFDDSNYDFYCKHENANNKGMIHFLNLLSVVSIYVPSFSSLYFSPLIVQ